MGVHVIKVPDVGEGVAEVELVAWTVAVGDPVARNQVLAEVMTDKANVEIPAPIDGVIADLHGEVGEIMAVGSNLIQLTIDGDGDLTPAATAPEPASVAPTAAEHEPDDQVDRGVLPFPQPGSRRGESEPAAEPAFAPEPEAHPAVAANHPAATAPGPVDVVASPVGAAVVARREAMPVPGAASAAPAEPPPGAAADGDRQIRAAPAVRRRLRHLGLDPTTISGSGPEGRITHTDLDRYLVGGSRPASSTPPALQPGPAPAATPVPTAETAPTLETGPAATGGTGLASTAADDGGAVQVEPLIGLRRQIAQRMVTATTTIPHITYVEEIDVTALEELRATLNAERNEGQPKLTILPFLIRAMVIAIAEQPRLNAHLDDDANTLAVHRAVHVGVATQTDRGLLVPVVADADRRSLWSLAAEIGRVAAAARDRRAEPSELSGSTITVSSLGALGGVVSTPVINKPEVAIVGVNKIDTRPVWNGNAFTPRLMMNLSSSFDHRVIDGFDAASFVQRIRAALEQPALLFMASEPPAEP